MKKLIILFVFTMLFLVGCKKQATTPTTPTVSTTWSLIKENPGYPARYQPATVVYNNKLWLMFGITSIGNVSMRDVWNSSDGLTWQCITGTASLQGFYKALTFNAGSGDKMWVLGSTQIFNSSDGITWPQVSTNTIYPQREDYSVIAFNNVFGNKMYVVGGQYGVYTTIYNDVWSSANGTDWVSVTSNAAFSPRCHGVLLKYDNGTGEKLWLISGDDYFNTYNDVWYSSNGSDWILATGNANFSTRTRATGFVYNNKMWIVGGAHSFYATTLNDAWYSTDGINWTMLTDFAFNSINCVDRENPLSQVFNNKAWLIFCSDYSSLNQLWSY
jgi:hypothetical protein